MFTADDDGVMTIEVGISASVASVSAAPITFFKCGKASVLLYLLACRTRTYHGSGVGFEDSGHAIIRFVSKETFS